jgi:hypothetical protein
MFSPLSFLAISNQEKEMLQVNETRSGKLPGGVGESKFLVVLESDSLDEVNSPDAKRMALDFASQHGWGNAGLTDTNPVVGAVDERTDEIIKTLEPIPPKRYRIEFTIAKRL